MCMFATRIIRLGYQSIAKPLFFRRDPEAVHDQIVQLGSWIGDGVVVRELARRVLSYADPRLEQDLLGIHFSNPVGLAAGFDKNGWLTSMLPAVGFGHEEVGSVTGEPCEGNPRPRLWRLPKSRALMVYYGLKNDGCERIAQRLEAKRFEIPIGISVARTNVSDTADTQKGIEDYKKAFCAFLNIGQYVTLNISCPNVFGGESFTEPHRLELLLTAIDAVPTTKPIFLKISSDLTTQQLDALVVVADRHRVHGFILSNLLKQFDHPKVDQTELTSGMHGGMSGRPTFEKSNTLISHLYQTVGKRYVIVGCGGIFSAQDAFEKIRQGASLVQLITGMIYEGPQLIGEINRGLVDLLTQNGFKNIQEAVGSAHRGACVRG